MKNTTCSILFLWLSAILMFGQGNGRPVHLRPLENAPVIGTLSPDRLLAPPTEPTEISDEAKESGWRAISFLDNFSGYVKRSEVRKDLTLTDGTPIYLSAVEDPSLIITRAFTKDIIEIERLDGLWSQVRFRKPVTGFVQTGTGISNDGSRESSPAPTAAAEPEPEFVETPPVPERVRIAERAAVPSDGVLRAFEGWLSPTRSFFGRNQPFAHQATDEAGNRIAYLDLGRLLITTPLDQFYGRRFEFYGRAEPIEGRREFVIRVERILKK